MRRYQRVARQHENEQANTFKSEYKFLRKSLNVEIIKAKERSWVKLCSAIEADPWGLPYKVVAKKASDEIAWG